MRKKWFVLFLTGVMAVMCTACGGEYAGTTEGEAVSGSAVSGGAVSGQAVSGGAVSDPVVSGPALQDKGTENFVSKKKKSKYQFCNDSHLYYMENGFQPIIEYDLSDGSRREIKFGKDQLGEEDRIEAICYVDNDWVWYVKEIDTFTAYGHWQAELWRAPVENGRLNVKKEEFVFSDPLVMEVDELYCDGRYVFYVTEESQQYRKYDLKEKKYLFNDTLDEDEYEEDMLVAVTGGTAFIDGDDGVFRQDLDSSEKVMVTEESGLGEHVAVTEEDLFYPEEAWNEDTREYSYKICQYHLKDGSKKEIITGDQIQRVLKEGGFWEVSGKTGSKSSNEWYWDYLFVSENRLYVQIGLYWDENGVTVSKKVVLSQKIGSKNELRYEKGLTECLANPKNNQKKFEKIYDGEEDEYEDEMCLFLSRGTCLYMSGKKCFMELYDPEQDKNRVACYDLSSGSMKFLTKKDPDWYVPFYDWVSGWWREEYLNISGDMPNNKKVDWPYW